jgi:hypothetical protein
MTKVIVACRNFVNARKNGTPLPITWQEEESFLQTILTGCGVNPTYYLVGFFPWDKAAETCCWPFTSV